MSSGPKTIPDRRWPRSENRRERRTPSRTGQRLEASLVRDDRRGSCVVARAGGLQLLINGCGPTRVILLGIVVVRGAEARQRVEQCWLRVLAET